jgi:hypothetical protein
MALDRMLIPPLYQAKAGSPLPIETTGATGKTAYLNIELKVNAAGGQPALPVTAVFAPDPSQLAGEVNVLLWFHGDKRYWQADGQSGESFSGQSIQHYLNGPPMCRLREFILKTSKNFLLVAPTLNDRTGGNGGQPAGVLWDQTDAHAYLQQALNGANKHLGVKGTKLGNIVLAAHSGGGHIQARMAGDFAGDPFTRMNEVWCFDSTYWGDAKLQRWAEKPHSNAKLFVYATGGSTASAARSLVRYSQPTPPPPPPRGQPNFRDVIEKPGTGVSMAVLRKRSESSFGTVMLSMTDFDVLIEGDKGNATNQAWTEYGGGAGGHYESIPKYLPLLVERSRNL